MGKESEWTLKSLLLGTVKVGGANVELATKLRKKDPRFVPLVRAMTEELSNFVERAKEEKVSNEEIKTAVRKGRQQMEDLLLGK